jgi:cellulose synthase/poly-beta-1,6-N-acetylglucosamine synthase-like glycosyltransferase
MKTPQIWSMHSTVLGGFYQSSVIVLAIDQESAIEAACLAIDEHINTRIDETYYVSINNHTLDPDDDDFDQDRANAIAAFRAEAEEKLAPVTSGRIVQHSS